MFAEFHKMWELIQNLGLSVKQCGNYCKNQILKKIITK
ncbi:hypothetical protein G436_1579 [Leptospira interrogans serovar Hardjo str. Norma]|uniref:Uncharacterized protein n=1 Tax=Leptospira interrogans serovar Hardjo str. Norma TaxID=1279460 RepID=A0A0M5L7K0_LEPIR|nr:hypothetical protein G436_1579 [Leptospira interrogans serovar Hardjo str. Norma]